MNDTQTLHYIINCVAGFSFLTSAGFIALVHVPHTPIWRHLHRCKYYLSLIFLVVGLSCCKTVLLHLGSSSDVIATSTLISAGIQALLFACLGITFVNPNWVTRRWAWTHILLILFYAVALLTGILWWRPWFWISATLACIIYFAQLISYQFQFFGEYNRCVHHTDTLTDEYSESRFAWIKKFFIAVSTLGVTAGIVPFLPTVIYDIWMLLAAVFYVYVVLSFVNYWGSTAQLVNKVYQHREDPDEKKADEHTEVAFEQLERALSVWKEQRGFIKNDLVSEDFAQSLGVNIATLRSYFSQRYQMDFRQWRTQLRIEYACTILKENPDYSYDTIAELVGICDRSNFMRNFKKITGMTPREYADSLQEQEKNLIQ